MNENIFLIPWRTVMRVLELEVMKC